MRHLTFLTVVSVAGTVDWVTAPQLEQALQEAIRRCAVQPVRILLDLNQVTYLDREGVDCMLRVHEQVACEAGHLGLYEPNASVIRTLHQTDVDGASWMTLVEERLLD